MPQPGSGTADRHWMEGCRRWSMRCMALTCHIDALESVRRSSSLRLRLHRPRPAQMRSTLHRLGHRTHLLLPAGRRTTAKHQSPVDFVVIQALRPCLWDLVSAQIPSKRGDVTSLQCWRTCGAATALSRAALLTQTTNKSPKTSTLIWRLRPGIFLPPS
jgi:hypothetical protein